MLLRDSQSRRLFVLVAFGFALRLGLALALGIDAVPRFGTDQYEYDNYAWNLAQGRGYRGVSPDVADPDHLTAYRVPGTSLVWAGIYAVLGHSFAAVRVAHCLVGAATILLVYRVGRRSFDERVGLWAAAAYTVYPTALLYSTELMSEPLATLAFLGYLDLSLQYAERPRWGAALGAGLVLGGAMLIRPAFLFMLPLAGLWALWQFRGRWRELVPALSIPAIALVMLVPWTLRNARVFHAFIPFSTMGGSVLLQGNNRLVVTDPRFFGYSVWDTDLDEYEPALRSAGDELARDRLAKQFAVRWLKDNPDKWPFLARAKLLRAWTPLLQPASPRLYRLGTLFSWGPVLALFILGVGPTLVHHVRSGHPGWLVHLGILTYVFTAVIFFGNMRYRYPVEPLCLIIAVKTALFLAGALCGAGGLTPARTTSERTRPGPRVALSEAPLSRSGPTP